LSGGPAQRVALARALAIEPAVLLLDEPLAALDAQRRAEVRHVLRDVLAKPRAACILVTHDPVDALTLADRLIVLDGGRVAQEGSPADVAVQPRSEYVADLVGTNLYRGIARGAEIDIGAGAPLAVATQHHGDVFAIIPPHAVVLHTAPPHGSARNVVTGPIVAIDHLGPRVRVRVGGATPRSHPGPSPRSAGARARTCGPR
jgi:molybdate transport system ATP-binding protein